MGMKLFMSKEHRHKRFVDWGVSTTKYDITVPVTVSKLPDFNKLAKDKARRNLKESIKN